MCEVEIDPETGATQVMHYTVADDFGTVVNPLLLAGQIHGGVAQGIGQALLERCVYDQHNGQLLTGSLMDYRITSYNVCYTKLLRARKSASLYANCSVSWVRK